MMVILRLRRVAKAANGFNHIVLWIALARINHVVDGIDSTKMRMIGFARFSRHPDLMAVGIAIETAVAEVAAQQAKLPQVISNVLTDVGYCVVGTDDDLGVLIRALRLSFLSRFASGAAHDPATFVLPFRLQIKDALLLKLLESKLPEMQMKDLAFLGQKIVFDIQP